MSHFAKVNNGIVEQVIVAEPEFFNTFVDTSPGEWIQTSYNTRGNVHYLPDTWEASGRQPLRGNYAGIGYIYDRVNDVFYEPQPFPSWTINTATWLWEPPTPRPVDDKRYYWDESKLLWESVD